MIAITLLSLFFVSHSRPVQSGVISLHDLKPVTDVGGRDKEPLSIGGVALPWAYASDNGEDDAKRVYSIPKDARSFNFKAGVPDDVYISSDRQPSFEILIDGERPDEPRTQGDLFKGSPPINVDISVSGRHSVMIVLHHGGAVADASFVRGVPGDLTPHLLSPAENAKAMEGEITFQWAGVDGAVAYGITVVNLDLRDGAAKGAQRIWCATVPEPKYTFDSRNVPSGQYFWSVIAFGKSRALGSFSLERKLRISH